MQKEKIRWITVKGTHIPIKEGQTVEEAMQQTFYRQNEPYSQILDEGRKREAQKLAQVLNAVKDNSVQKLAYSLGQVRDLKELLGEEYVGYKGQDAVKKLLREKKGHIKKAFYRQDIGGIDVLWGNENLGIHHIIDRRKEQNIDIDDFFNGISDVIEKGDLVRRNSRGNYEIWKDGKMAVIASTYHENNLVFLLTAFKRRKK